MCIDNTVSRFASKLVSLYVASFKRDEWEKYIQELTDAEVTVGNFTNSLRNVDANIGSMIKSLDHSRRINSADWYIVDGNNRYSFDFRSHHNLFGFYLRCILSVTLSQMDEH